jgi:hypothetical protein
MRETDVGLTAEGGEEDRGQEKGFSHHGHFLMALNLLQMP